MKRAPWSPLLACALAAVACTTLGAGSVPGRVIVIGVDGLDYEVCREMIAAGDLPNLKQLAADGSFVPLQPTNPAQSPVSWATLTTGLNPGITGINDFLRREFREDGGVSAELSLSKLERRHPWRCGAVTPAVVVLGFAGLLALLGVVAWFRRSRWVAIAFVGIAGFVAALWFLAFLGPRFDPKFEPRLPVNARGGRAVWDTLDAAGIPTMSVLAPVAFPAPQLKHGHLISGLGVPDAMGTPGTYTSYRQEPVPDGRAITQTGCRVTSIRDEGGGAIGKIAVPGPRPGNASTRLEVPVGARVDRAAKTVRFDLAGHACVVGERQWSPFLAAKFDLPWFQDVSVLTRFRVIEAGDRVVIHQEPTCFDPRKQHPALAITSPIEYGDDVCAEGPFDTCGWGCATNPMQDEVIDEETFLSDIAEIEAQRQNLLGRTLRMPDWRLFFCVLSTPDRVQHMFWRDRDPAHPRHDAAAVARRGDPIRDAYRRIDTLVGRIRKEVLQAGDLLLVVSDHGFAPWRWSVNLNRFLAEEGFLAGTGDRTERTLETSLGGPSLFRGIDWTRTRAYSMGLGKIYVNLKGEPGGIVPPSERRALLADLQKRLLALRHEGRPVIRSAALREDLYRGDRVDESADLVIGFERGYRVSWQCTLGSLDEPVISPNQNLWSGDHCSVDPSLVPGVLFSSRPLAQDRAGVADITPTIETELGVKPAPGSDGRPLRFR